MTFGASLPLSMIARRVCRLTGNVRVPGDKSISHRALMFAATAIGPSVIEGLLEGEDVLRTAEAMRRLGASIKRCDNGVWKVQGRGVGALVEPKDVLDMGNAGTGVRLLMGLAASHSFPVFFTGDHSLRSRPMNRIMEPLSRMGANFVSRSGGLLPLMVTGSNHMFPIAYETPMPSAQVKSAILLAGLNIAGKTSVIEKESTRDHTELMLAGFGAEIITEHLPGGGRAVTLTGQPELMGRSIIVPADPSSAAFPAVAALLVQDSEVILSGVCNNPLRTGLFTTLQEMGGDLHWINERNEAGEAIGDLVVRHSNLKAVDVPAERAPSMVDEYPILAVAAAFAQGTSRMRGLAELRVKESNRLETTAQGLKACGVSVEIEGDDLIVHGNGLAPEGGGLVRTYFDHRIAMSFLVMGLATREKVQIDDGTAIDTSFPGFVELMNGLGANITINVIRISEIENTVTTDRL